MTFDWVPGVLSMRQVQALIKLGAIDGASDDVGAFDHSSMDLHLENEGWELPEGSMKPFGEGYVTRLKNSKLIQPLLAGDDGSFRLDRKKTYLFRLRERLQLRTFIKEYGAVYGQATAKSSIGRVDVLARLIVDGAHDYEMFTPRDLEESTGEMYIEITPITFNVRVKPGVSLNQLRLFLGAPHEVQVRGEVLYRQVLRGASTPDGSLSVDLSSTTIGGVKAAAFVATGESDQPVCLWNLADAEKPKPWQFWRLLEANRHDRLTIEKENFYILRSRERIALTKGVAVYCRASDETIGEMRIHYAGFVHPFFGRERADSEIGTPLIFEVRGHDVHVSLLDGEKMANLTFYRMSEDAVREDKKDEGPYNDQQLQLSKFFAPWVALNKLDKGRVAPSGSE